MKKIIIIVAILLLTVAIVLADPLAKKNQAPICGYIYTDELEEGYLIGYSILSNKNCSMIFFDNFKDLTTQIEELSLRNSYTNSNGAITNSDEHKDKWVFVNGLSESIEGVSGSSGNIVVALDNQQYDELCRIIDGFIAKIHIETQDNEVFDVITKVKKC